MASETVKELGIEVMEVSSDKQTASSIISRQGMASTLQRKGAWARAELRQLLEPKAGGGSLSLRVYTFCPGLFSRTDQVILGR